MCSSSSVCDCRICYDAVCNGMIYRGVENEVLYYKVLYYKRYVYIVVVVLTFRCEVFCVFVPVNFMFVAYFNMVILYIFHSIAARDSMYCGSLRYFICRLRLRTVLRCCVR